MINSGEAANTDSMLIVMAQSISSITGKFRIFFAPLAGILGSFISGSNTLSNIMFGNFQYITAIETQLKPTIILALQAVGGAAGNMICIHNVVAACATVEIIGKEGEVIRKNILIALLYGLFAGIIGWMIHSF